jgi:hypothetical protein
LRCCETGRAADKSRRKNSGSAFPKLATLGNFACIALTLHAVLYLLEAGGRKALAVLRYLCVGVRVCGAAAQDVASCLFPRAVASAILVSWAQSARAPQDVGREQFLLSADARRSQPRSHAKIPRNRQEMGRRSTRIQYTYMFTRAIRGNNRNLRQNALRLLARYHPYMSLSIVMFLSRFELVLLNMMSILVAELLPSVGLTFKSLPRVLSSSSLRFIGKCR